MVDSSALRTVKPDSILGGNLLRQPVFVQLRKDRPDAIRLVGSTIQLFNDRCRLWWG